VRLPRAPSERRTVAKGSTRCASGTREALGGDRGGATVEADGREVGVNAERRLAGAAEIETEAG
jgi:hypothetical protein